MPSDGSVNPTDLTQALAKGARMNGATIRENISFKEVLTKNGKIIGVSTEQGIISTDTVVNCGSMWARELGQQNFVSIPIHACEHYYLVAQPIPNLPSDLPVLRSHYDGTYWKQDTGKLLFRSDHFKAKAAIPENFDFDSLPFVEEDMMEVLEMSMNRVPVLQENGIQTFFNGPESCSHDGRFNLGESPNLKGYFLLAGVNSTGIQSGSGAEKALADWIMTGHPPMDSAEMDSARIEDWQTRDIYWQEHCPQTLVLTYAMQWPRRQREKARNLRRTPFYHAMKAHGTAYDEVQGWECPAWFAPEVVFPESDYSFYRPSCFNYVQEEQKTVTGSVGIIDYSLLQKLLVSGRDAENFLSRVCSNDLAIPVNSVIYSLMLYERGVIESDVMLAHHGPDSFMVISSISQTNRDLNHLKRNIRPNKTIWLSDATSSYGVLPLAGPKARDLSAGIT